MQYTNDASNKIQQEYLARLKIIQDTYIKPLEREFGQKLATLIPDFETVTLQCACAGCDDTLKISKDMLVPIVQDSNCSFRVREKLDMGATATPTWSQQKDGQFMCMGCNYRYAEPDHKHRDKK